MATDLLQSIATNEFDYNILHNRLANFRYPRNKIGSLLRSNKIIRVKKGLYVKGNEKYHLFVVANMIYGPSYVSEDSALAHYGMIPERVHTVTSTTFSRKRRYSTPIGEFHYNTTQRVCYSLGITRIELDARTAYLIATPEKALFDRLYHVEGLDTKAAMREYLFENMRLELTSSFNYPQLRKIGKLSGKPFVKTLIQALESEGAVHE